MSHVNLTSKSFIFMYHIVLHRFCLCFFASCLSSLREKACKFNAHVVVTVFIVVHWWWMHQESGLLSYTHLSLETRKSRSCLWWKETKSIHSWYCSSLSSTLTSLHLYPKCLLTDLWVGSRASEVHEEMLVCFEGESVFKILFQDRNGLPNKTRNL